MLDEVVGRQHLDKLLRLVNAVGIPGGGKAFDQLTTIKVRQASRLPADSGQMAKFNIETPDDPAVKYFSYTASYKPGWFDIMRKSWQVIHDVDGSNDGLVSVTSQRWGDVQGNLEDVNHRTLVFARPPHATEPMPARHACLGSTRLWLTDRSRFDRLAGTLCVFAAMSVADFCRYLHASTLPRSLILLLSPLGGAPPHLTMQIAEMLAENDF